MQFISHGVAKTCWFLTKLSLHFNEWLQVFFFLPVYEDLSTLSFQERNLLLPWNALLGTLSHTLSHAHTHTGGWERSQLFVTQTNSRVTPPYRNDCKEKRSDIKALPTDKRIRRLVGSCSASPKGRSRMRKTHTERGKVPFVLKKQFLQSNNICLRLGKEHRHPFTYLLKQRKEVRGAFSHFH